MYQVFARKWRPQSFGELVGQQHISRTLSNAIENDRLAHAYIFSGLRGTGKRPVWIGWAAPKVAGDERNR